MIIGIGVDLVKVERVRQKAGENFDTPLARGAFTESELAYAKSMGVVAYQSLAGFFAAKEAFFKATQVWPGWHDIWVEHEPGGKPYFGLSEKAREKMRALDIEPENADVQLTISHEKEFAVAVVVAERWGSSLAANRV
jgi:holo-[acyl-carrier protein] synthase